MSLAQPGPRVQVQRVVDLAWGFRNRFGSAQGQPVGRPGDEGLKGILRVEGPHLEQRRGSWSRARCLVRR